MLCWCGMLCWRGFVFVWVWGRVAMRGWVDLCCDVCMYVHGVVCGVGFGVGFVEWACSGCRVCGCGCACVLLCAVVGFWCCSVLGWGLGVVCWVGSSFSLVCVCERRCGMVGGYVIWFGVVCVVLRRVWCALLICAYCFCLQFDVFHYFARPLNKQKNKSNTNIDK
jgi:hypothetical protein